MESEKREVQESSGESFTRRHFLTLVGTGAITTATVGSGILFVQFASPNVLFEPAMFFKAGKPEEYQPGVDERWKQKQKIWIVRRDEDVYALVAICPHLGCTPDWDAEDQAFHCPCHGSAFSLEGDVLSGPAPVPLYRAPLQVDETGEFVIGTGLLGFGRPEQENRDPERNGPGFVVKVEG